VSTAGIRPSFPPRCVVDASVLIKVVLQEPGSATAHALLAAAALDARNLPDFAYLECASILNTSVRRGIVTPAQAQAALRLLHAAPVTIHPTNALVSNALNLALIHGTSVYDAVYLALADALAVPLITADTTLVATMRGAFITVVDLHGFP
jgi:predicted nucleic acid-binding protein